MDGGQVRLADFKGRPILVNFWATWCAPCKLEHPLLVEMAGQGVEIVGMLYKDPKGIEAAHELLARDGNPCKHIGLDPLGDLGIDIGISGVPESFLIDANGQIVKTKRNYFVESDVADYVAAYRAEQAKAGAAPGVKLALLGLLLRLRVLARGSRHVFVCRAAHRRLPPGASSVALKAVRRFAGIAPSKALSTSRMAGRAASSRRRPSLVRLTDLARPSSSAAARAISPCAPSAPSSRPASTGRSPVALTRSDWLAPSASAIAASSTVWRRVVRVRRPGGQEDFGSELLGPAQEVRR